MQKSVVILDTTKKNLKQMRPHKTSSVRQVVPPKYFTELADRLEYVYGDKTTNLPTVISTNPGPMIDGNGRVWLCSVPVQQCACAVWLSSFWSLLVRCGCAGWLCGVPVQCACAVCLCSVNVQCECAVCR